MYRISFENTFNTEFKEYIRTNLQNKGINILFEILFRKLKNLALKFYGYLSRAKFY